jgi:hypothetical protein
MVSTAVFAGPTIHVSGEWIDPRPFVIQNVQFVECKPKIYFHKNDSGEYIEENPGWEVGGDLPSGSPAWGHPWVGNPWQSYNHTIGLPLTSTLRLGGERMRCEDYVNGGKHF